MARLLHNDDYDSVSVSAEMARENLLGPGRIFEKSGGVFVRTY
jgi:hypothetical protein